MLRDALLSEFDSEMKVTRTVLAALPEARTSFRPHKKSWTAGELSLHVANVPWWLVSTLESTELDLLGPQIWRLLRDAERSVPTGPAGDPDAVEYEKRIELMT